MVAAKTKIGLSYEPLVRMNRKISLALVDDHQIVIDGLMSLLKGHEVFRLSFATTDPTEVLAKMAEHPVEILLTDVMMPGLTGWSSPTPLAA